MNDTTQNWETRSMTELIGHLLQHHHSYTRTALEELAPLMKKVLSVHGAEHPELAELAALLRQLHEDMGQHLPKEEMILFPYILKLEVAAPLSPPPFGTVENPIRMMAQEHHADGMILHKMQGVTDNFTPPADACASFTALYSGLDALVKDLRMHIYLENNILFAKAIEQERNRFASA
jgi:regulator of cell morphogenesis and NO signaling